VPGTPVESVQAVVKMVKALSPLYAKKDGAVRGEVKLG